MDNIFCKSLRLYWLFLIRNLVFLLLNWEVLNVKMEESILFCWFDLGIYFVWSEVVNINKKLSLIMI